MKDLSGKVAVITGGASGIGLGIARQLARRGTKLVLADIEGAALERAASDLAKEGADVVTCVTDVAKAADVEALARRAIEAFGKVHVVCNNAGVGTGGASWEHTLHDWEWVLGVNLWGVIHGVRTFVPILIEQGEEAHVVNTASMAGLLSGPFMSVYSVAKHGVVTLSESLHLELKLRGTKVRASVLCPGWVHTNITDSGRNRPASLQDGAVREMNDQEKMMDAMLRSAVASGMSPDDVGAQVVDAILQEKFWILTHPNWKSAVRRWADRVMEEREPEFEPPV